jgi:hypothetical protein
VDGETREREERERERERERETPKEGGVEADWSSTAA